MLDLGKAVKDAVQRQGMLAWQYNTIGVSDAITMGGEGDYGLGQFCARLTDMDRHAILSPKQRNHR